MPGRVAAREAHAAAGEPLQLAGIHALDAEHRPLGLRAAGAVLADVAVGADDAVAGDDERDRVAGERLAHGAHGPRPADLARHPGVGPHLAEGDLHRLAQHAPLELGQRAEVDGRPAGALAARRRWTCAAEPRRHLGHARDRPARVAAGTSVSKPSGSPARSTAVMPSVPQAT